MSKRKIVIAVDGSSQAEYAFNWYVNCVKKEDDHVIVVHCPDAINPPLPTTPLTPHFAWTEAIQNQNKATKELQDVYAAKIRENKVSGDVMIVEGSPGHAVVKVADKEHATAIVMGTRGLGTVRRTLLGSQSDFVLHHAHCPVMICRKQ